MNIIAPENPTDTFDVLTLHGVVSKIRNSRCFIETKEFLLSIGIDQETITELGNSSKKIKPSQCGFEDGKLSIAVLDKKYNHDEVRSLFEQDAWHEVETARKYI